MNLLNIHEHPIVIYIFQNNNFVKEEVLPPRKSSKISCNDLYCIICEKCNDLNNDFNSKYQLQNRNGSLFVAKEAIGKYKNENLIFFKFSFSDFCISKSLDKPSDFSFKFENCSII